MNNVSLLQLLEDKADEWGKHGKAFPEGKAFFSGLACGADFFYQPADHEGDQEAGDGTDAREDHGLGYLLGAEAEQDGEEGTACCTGKGTSLCARGGHRLAPHRSRPPPRSDSRPTSPRLLR